MSTRHARTADKASNEKFTKILKALLQKTPNKYCADCKKKDARWASWNLGIFICIRCSGIHRSLGVHIMKSVDLDTWVQDQVENMVRWGNERANKYWEANLKDKKPSESNMELWIRAKYEQKRWAMKGPIPDPSTLGGDDDNVDNVVSTPKSASSASSSARQSPGPPKQKQSEFANLDAFLDSPSSSPALSHQTTPKSAASAPAATQLKGADFFFDNASSSASPVANTTTNASPSQTQKTTDFSSILSLYKGIPAATPPPQQQQQQQYNGSFQSQMAGLNMGGNQTHIQHTNNNNMNSMWGSFGTPPASQPQQPQGSQFFTSTTNVPSKNPEKKDVFADLLG
ncbi:hypothetical protein [Parasitella parasitica]|uniref:Arf-GAP domain-containing protein n=1 Tax=Parasitella parasitica TaxID=35722 RepID=A0A0B7NHT1_9FUNG|nr:hypothetical protein [Parasitella parasitica]